MKIDAKLAAEFTNQYTNPVKIEKEEAIQEGYIWLIITAVPIEGKTVKPGTKSLPYYAEKIRILVKKEDITKLLEEDE